MPVLPPHLFCFGFGYSARALARRLLSQGWRITGTCRSAESEEALRAEGVATQLFGPGRPFPSSAFAGASHILVSIPPQKEGDLVLDTYGKEIAALESLAWLGYLSSTAVYGDQGGGWVDESSPLLPKSLRARQRASAEEGWLSLKRERGQPVHIFRLAAIYGPGRSAFEALRAGTAKRIDKPQQLFSRIHVEDLARLLEASIARPRPGAVYNVADDEPAAPEAVVLYAARLLGVPPPPLLPLEKAALSPLAKSFYDDNKRVRNDLIKKEFSFRLGYPDYRAGLASILHSPEISCRKPRARSSSSKQKSREGKEKCP